MIQPQGNEAVSETGSVRDGIPADIWQIASDLATAPITSGALFSEVYVRPVALAILAERERCAKIAEDCPAWSVEETHAAQSIAAAIRSPDTIGDRSKI